jgi:Tol biopolymer transport system component
MPKRARFALAGSVVALVALALAAAPALATFSGTNGRITFNMFNEATESIEIFSVAPDGSDLQQLTSNPDRVSFFTDWSPDGQKIAFDSDRTDDGVQIWTMDWDGSNEVQLTAGEGFHGDPAYSPDGLSLAIDSDWNDPAKQGIWIIPSSGSGIGEADATRVTTVPPTADFDSEPQFSPDGEWIVFTRFKSCGEHEHGHLAGFLHHCTQALYRVHPDGSGLRRLTAWGMEASAPDFSPDGEWITFDAGDSGAVGTRPSLWKMHPDGTGLTRLTKTTVITNVSHDFENLTIDFDNNPVFAPQNNRIVFVQFGFDANTIQTINTSGGDRTSLFGPGPLNKPDWGTHP